MGLKTKLEIKIKTIQFKIFMQTRKALSAPSPKSSA
jgi:hypothetical protein